MKKTVLRAAALAIVLVMAAAIFAACGQNDAKVIIGKWETTVDMGKFAAEDFDEYAAMIGDLDLTGITMKMIVEFKDDGTYATSLDKDSAEAAFSAMLERMKPAMTEMFRTQLAESLSMDPAEITDEYLDSLLGMMGMGSIDDMIEMVKSEMDIEKSIQENSTKGRYMLKNGKIYTTESVDEQATVSSGRVLYELTPSVLKIDVEKDEDVPESLKGMLPMSFTKVG